jgi:hypothetical protein
MASRPRTVLYLTMYRHRGCAYEQIDFETYAVSLPPIHALTFSHFT